MRQFFLRQYEYLKNAINFRCEHANGFIGIESQALAHLIITLPAYAHRKDTTTMESVQHINAVNNALLARQGQCRLQAQTGGGRWPDAHWHKVSHTYWQLLLLVLPLEQFLLHRENLCLANTLSDALKIWACFSNRVWSERGQNLCAFFLGGGGTEQHIVVSIPKLYRKSLYSPGFQIHSGSTLKISSLFFNVLGQAHLDVRLE